MLGDSCEGEDERLGACAAFGLALSSPRRVPVRQDGTAASRFFLSHLDMFQLGTSLVPLSTVSCDLGSRHIKW